MGGLGERDWAQWEEVRHVVAVMGTLLCVGVRPRYWGRTLRLSFPWWRVPGNALAQRGSAAIRRRRTREPEGSAEPRPARLDRFRCAPPGMEFTKTSDGVNTP